jgi:hypothetical protein
MATKSTPLASKPPSATRKPAAAKPSAKASLARRTATAAARKVAVAGLTAKSKVQPAQPSEASPAKVGKKSVKPRPVLVRDSFTMPEADFALIAKLKSEALGARRAAKKSELLRAGLQLLAALDAKSLVVALDRLETVKTGRPRKGH